MNKLFTKIAALALGATMAVGVGVAVASNKEATPVHAAGSSDWVQVTALSGLNTTDTYVIANDADKGYYMNGTVSSGHFQSTAFSASAPASATAAGAFKLEAIDASNNIYSIKLASTSKYVYATKAGSGGGSVTGSSDSSGWKFLLSGTSFNAIYQTAYSSKYAAMRCYNNTSWRTYSNNSATSISTTSGTVFRLYKYQSKTLSSIAVSGYKTSFTVGDSFSFGGTVTATYSDASTANVTSSATFSGYDMSTAGNQTVTASYTEGSVTKTATYGITVSAATSPYINPAKASTSGYTGQNETLSFTYGNLTSTLGVSSSNTSVVTVETPSYSAGEGTVQINFVGAGSTTVKFNDGSTELASVSVTVTASSVSITGMPATKTIGNGATIDLGALITVTPTGTCSSDVTWSTGNSSIATVTQVGVVTGEGVGSTTITVTPDDYPAGAVSCTVTVANILTATFATGTTDGSALDDDAAIKAVTGYSVDSNIEFTSVTKVYGSEGNALKFGASSAKGSITVGLIDGQVNSKNAYITKIVVNAITYGTDATTIQIAGTDHALTSSWADYEEEFDGTSTTTVLIEAKNASKNRFRISSIQIFYDFVAELDSVTTSGQTTSFTQDGAFAYGGTLTAHYTQGKADATVTPTAYKYGDSGFNPASAGTTITIGTTLSVDTHNGKYISVGYTEDGITKWSALYQITVSYAAVTSVTLSENTAEIGLSEVFDYNLVTVTVSPSNANQDYTWSVLSNTVNDDYVFDASGLLSGDTEGTVTLKCASDADASKYATLVVTITGDPTAAFVKESTSGYAGKSEEIAFTYGNIDDENKITVASSNSSIVSVANDLVADGGEGLVTINFVAAGSANVTISYDGGETLDTLPVTVSADSVVSVSWNASNFNVFSGTTLTSEIDNTWLASYEMASGDEDLITYGDYTLKLGGTAITLPHTWVAADDGKTLCIEYGGVSSSTVSVAVTQTLQAVMAPVEGDPVTKTWSATSGCLGTAIGTVGNSATGTLTFDDESTMSYTRTLEYVASGKADYVSFSSPYQQFGSSNALNTLVLEASNSDKVTQVVVTCWAKNGATDVSVTVGGNAFDTSKSAPSAAGSVTFTGEATGDIVITMEKSSKTAGCAQYIASVAITTVESTGETINIANVAGHEAAQKAVVAFAKAMNAAFDETENCTDGVDAAWETASDAYASNITNNASLSDSEKAYANNLIKYAEARYTENTDNDYSYCLERAMATYEACVQKHGQTPFLSSVRPVGRIGSTNPITIIGNKSDVNVIAIVVITSVISLTAIGGYFFLRKRKENI